MYKHSISKTTKIVSHQANKYILAYIQHPNTEIWNIMGYTIDNLIPNQLLQSVANLG